VVIAVAAFGGIAGDNAGYWLGLRYGYALLLRYGEHANASGGIIWAAGFGLGGYFFGKLLTQLHHALAPFVFALALAAFFGCGYLVRHYETRLTVLSEHALPGPLAAAAGEKRR
jgi:membrane protein DedA with SNARE-associated domain